MTDAQEVAAPMPCALCLDRAKAECEIIFRDIGEVLNAEQMASECCTHAL